MHSADSPRSHRQVREEKIMEEAEARKARLAAMRARASGGRGDTSAAGGGGVLLTPQMLGAPPPDSLYSHPPSSRPPEPLSTAPLAPMASTGFYSAMQMPSLAQTPAIETFSMGDRPLPPQQQMHQMAGLPTSFRGGVHVRGGAHANMQGRGGFHGGMHGMQAGGPQRGESDSLVPSAIL